MLRRSVLGTFLATVSASSHALYDPAPHPLLSRLPGSWRGSLTYRDWDRPDQLVTIACRAYIAMLAPDDLGLYLVFEEGVGKAVYSYDRWSFEFGRRTMTWGSGMQDTAPSQYEIVSTDSSERGSAVVLSKAVEDRIYRQVLQTSGDAWRLDKTEIGPGGSELLRNFYEMRRTDS